MINSEEEKLYERVNEVFSEDSQLCAAIEEMGELTVELSKILNGKRNLSSESFKLLDELVDVNIMIGQLVYNYGLKERFLDHKKYKMIVIKDKIKKWENK